MSFLIQHGFGKGRTMSTLADEGLIDGAILSPANESIEAMRATIGAIASTREVLLDPQSYIYSMSPEGSGRYHAEHGIDFSRVHWSQAPSTTSAHVTAVGDANAILGTSAWIAPAPLQPSMVDVWTSLTFQYAREAARQWGADRTIISLALQPSAFDDWSTVSDWLDVATSLRVRGTYVASAPISAGYPPPADSNDQLLNSMRFTRALHRNGSPAIWGYADLEGLLHLAAGASAIASGWSYSLRAFRPNKWQPVSRGGGRQPLARLFVPSLLSTPLAETELRQILRSRSLSKLLTDSELDWLEELGLEALPRSTSQLEHLRRFAMTVGDVSDLSDADRLVRVPEMLREAEGRWMQIEGAGFRWARPYAERLRAYSRALTAFRTAEGL